MLGDYEGLVALKDGFALIRAVNHQTCRACCCCRWENLTPTYCLFFPHLRLFTVHGGVTSAKPLGEQEISVKPPRRPTLGFCAGVRFVIRNVCFSDCYRNGPLGERAADQRVHCEGFGLWLHRFKGRSASRKCADWHGCRFQTTTGMFPVTTVELTGLFRVPRHSFLFLDQESISFIGSSRCCVYVFLKALWSPLGELVKSLHISGSLRPLQNSLAF